MIFLMLKLSCILFVAICGSAISVPASTQTFFPIFPSIRNLFQHELAYSSGQIQGSISYSNNPFEVNAGFRMRNPLELPNNFFRPLPPPRILSPIFQPFRPIMPNNLFTPSRDSEPAATKGQVDNYNKALTDEATEMENTETTIQYEMTSDTEAPKSSVNVHVRGLGDEQYNYSYSV